MLKEKLHFTLRFGVYKPEVPKKKALEVKRWLVKNIPLDNWWLRNSMQSEYQFYTSGKIVGEEWITLFLLKYGDQIEIIK